MTLFDGWVPSQDDVPWRHEWFREELRAVQPEAVKIDDTIHQMPPHAIGRHPGEMPTPELATERYENGREAVYGESIEWKLRQRGHTPAIYAGKVKRELLERIDAKLACYEANGQKQAEELDRIREEEPDLHEEMMEECRELLIATGTTGDRIPVAGLLRHVDEPDQEELSRLMNVDRREVRQRAIRLASKLELA